MKIRQLIIATLFLTTMSAIGCRDKDLYPLPYDDREVGAYMRLYSLSSNIINLSDLANSGLDGVFEAVDANNGNNLQEFRILVSHRRGSAVSSEVPIKTIAASEFAAVAEPTISQYRRARIRVTATETLAALASATGFPGSLANADQVIYRGVMVLKDGREFSGTNTTPNIAGGQFYSASFLYTLTVRSQSPTSWLGDYSLTQTSIWSFAHSPALHATPQFPAYLNQRLFENGTVTLQIPTGGLSTQRQFTVRYRGQNVTFTFNLEPTPTGAVPTSGTVFIPLQNTGINCNSERQIYWTQPTAGNFTATPFPTLPAGLPQGATANQGSFNTSQNGLVAGQTITIGLDDDADEYGRRNGYCTFTRRVRLTLTKL